MSRWLIPPITVALLQACAATTPSPVRDSPGPPVASAAANRGAASLAALVEALPAAVGADDRGAVLRLCTPELAARRYDCEGLYDQAASKGFNYRAVDTRPGRGPEGARGVIVYDAVNGDRVLNRMMAYAVERDGAWMIDGIDEDERHAQLFVAGRAPATLEIEELPESPELRDLARAIVAAAAATGTAHVDGTAPGQDLEETLGRVRTLSRPRITATHLASDLQLGVIQLTGGSGDELNLYVAGTAHGWRFYEFGYGPPDARTLLQGLE